MKKQTTTDSGTPRLRTPDRSQVVIRMESPEGLIPAGHHARVIWQVVEAMDLSAFLEPIKAREHACGRDATSPKLLVALWLYATTRGVGSARELAKLCTEAKPYQWLCGGVTLNHHLLSDYRVDHGQALDELMTRSIATLADKKLIKVFRISQDGTRVRACAGASSFRRSERLNKLLELAKTHVAELKALLEDPERSAGLSARKKAARQRAARERQERVEQAIAALPELGRKQKKLEKKIAKKDKSKKLKEPRASTTDAEARVMKMPDGGFRPAVNMQFAVDADSRAVLGVDVVDQGSDHHLSEPMRKQVEQRTGQKVSEQLLDGGYLVKEEIERGAAAGVTLYVPPKPPRNKDERGDEYEPMPGESQVLTEWRARMGGAEGKAIYKQRAATSETVNAETVNADLKAHRGLDRMRVRGLKKAKCVALWMALAYNLMHFSAGLIG
jgi:transposase